MCGSTPSALRRLPLSACYYCFPIILLYVWDIIVRSSSSSLHPMESVPFVLCQLLGWAFTIMESKIRMRLTSTIVHDAAARKHSFSHPRIVRIDDHHHSRSQHNLAISPYKTDPKEFFKPIRFTVVLDSETQSEADGAGEGKRTHQKMSHGERNVRRILC